MMENKRLDRPLMPDNVAITYATPYRSFLALGHSASDLVGIKTWKI